MGHNAGDGDDRHAVAGGGRPGRVDCCLSVSEMSIRPHVIDTYQLSMPLTEFQGGGVLAACFSGGVVACAEDIERGGRVDHCLRVSTMRMRHVIDTC